MDLQAQTWSTVMVHSASPRQAPSQWSPLYQGWHRRSREGFALFKKGKEELDRMFSVILVKFVGQKNFSTTLRGQSESKEWRQASGHTSWYSILRNEY